jgi:hypothetical protein
MRHSVKRMATGVEIPEVRREWATSVDCAKVGEPPDIGASLLNRVSGSR